MSSRRPVVLSLEQALSMSYATLRMVHLGWRVIKIEPTPVPGRQSRGDPNRRVGRPMAGPDLHSYFVSPNAGKQAIALNLKREDGRNLLAELIDALEVDVFCTNTLPMRHSALGIDADRLRRGRPELIWCSISAMGLERPEVPGYDPVLQALCGYMDLTGDPTGPPMQCGPPLLDLKAGDEALTQVALALLAREQTGLGRTIDLSMARMAVSWLHTFLPMLDMGSPPDELRRSGNQHRQFIPVNAYPARDGWLYLAVGSDAQWSRLVRQPRFSGLDEPALATNEGRRAQREALHARIGALTREADVAELTAELRRAKIPHAPITPIEGVPDLDFVAAHALHTTAPDGRRVRLPPAAVDTPHLDAVDGALPFAPDYGADTDRVLAEAGLTPARIASLRAQEVIA